jgi:predicted lipoprotein with Yx(FWY)xxD motif
MEATMRRNHRWAAAAPIAAAALAVTACSHNTYATGSGTGTQTSNGGAYSSPYAGSRSAGPAGGASTTALKTEATRAGTVLASPKGLTLYYYAGDKPGSGRSACTGGCAAAWPALVAPVRAPNGVRLPGTGTIGFITRPDGTRQVTINGYPVYRYAEDTAPGQAKGNGEEGEWHVIKV